MQGCLIETDFFISRISIVNNDKTHDLVLGYVNNNDLEYEPFNSYGIKIRLQNKMDFEKLNRFLKCNNIQYEVLNIKGDKELIHERYHHMIEA